MKRDSSLTIRLPAELKTALAEAAERDQRSVSQYCVFVLSNHLGLGHELRNRPRARARKTRVSR
jgi:hypothetical protein